MNTSEEHIYDVTIEWNQGRIGTMRSEKLDNEIEVATPPEFPGGVEGIWSPEHLFVAAVSSCLMTTFTAIAENSKLAFQSLQIKSLGTMSRQDGKFWMSKVTLRPLLVINDKKYEQKAYRILEKAEEVCLISRSIKSDIVFEPEVRVVVDSQI